MFNLVGITTCQTTVKLGLGNKIRLQALGLALTYWYWTEFLNCKLKFTYLICYNIVR